MLYPCRVDQSLQNSIFQAAKTQRHAANTLQIVEYFATWIVFAVCQPRVFATNHFEFCEDPGDEVNCTQQYLKIVFIGLGFF